MPSREEWVDAALGTTAAEGIGAVRIDRLAGELGVTKGSFHHHFRGAAGLRAAMLEAFAQRADEAQERFETIAADLDTLTALRALADASDTLLDVALERSVRAWATHDEEARDAIERVDAARLGLLERVWERSLPPGSAHIAALLPHLVLVGATSTSTTRQELRALFEMLATTATAVPGADR